MKKYGFGFDDKNIKESIINDYTGRNKYLVAFIELLNSQDQYSKIAFDGKWGIGKTYFIKQLEYILNSGNELKEYHPWSSIIKNINYKVIYFNSWESEDSIDPIIPLLRVIKKDNNLNKSLKKMIGRIVEITTKNLIRENDIENLISKDPIEEFNKELENYLKNELSNNKRLIIFVDELDRCKPTYAIKLLERISHCFKNDELSFVFVTNLSELSNSVRNIYGSNFNSSQYFDKFFDYVISLPPLSETNLKKYVYFNLYNHREELSDNTVKIAEEIVKHFNFTPRQINHYFTNISLIKNTLAEIKKFNNGDEYIEVLYYLVNYFGLFILALKFQSIAKYDEFINGNRNDSIVNFFKNSESSKSDFIDLVLKYKLIKKENVWDVIGHKSNKDDQVLKNEIKKNYDKIINTIYMELFNNQKSNVTLLENKYTVEQYKDNLFSIISLIGNYNIY